MCVLYVSFGSKVRPIIVGCVAMGSAVLFIFRSRLLLYSTGSGVNKVQVLLSGYIFPDELKLAKVIPIYKSGSSMELNNYRPISVLNIFS